MFIFAVTLLIGLLVVPPYYAPIPNIPTVTPIKNEIASPQVLVEETPVIAEYDLAHSKKNLVWASSFYSEDFPFKNNSRWFGLFKKGNKYSVKPTRLKVSKIKNPDLYDLDVTTSDPEKSVFLFKDLPTVKESDVTTLFDGSGDEETGKTLTTTPQEFDLNGIHYSIVLFNPTNSDYPEPGSKLILKTAETSQVLRYIPDGCNDCSWQLLWAGDLDNDGKLDLYLNLTPHYNIEKNVLFLSSPAEKGKLVKHVADFYSVGC